MLKELTNEETQSLLSKNPEQMTVEELRAWVPQLVTEVVRLGSSLKSYNASIESKLDGIEEDMLKLEAENRRLLQVKEAILIERSALAGLVAQMAMALGRNAGITRDTREQSDFPADARNLIVADLPSGQVSWNIADSDFPLFEHFPNYTGPVDFQPIEEIYHRVFNPDLQSSVAELPGGSTQDH